MVSPRSGRDRAAGTDLRRAQVCASPKFKSAAERWFPGAPVYFRAGIGPCSRLAALEAGAENFASAGFGGGFRSRWLEAGHLLWKCAGRLIDKAGHERWSEDPAAPAGTGGGARPRLPVEWPLTTSGDLPLFVSRRPLPA